MQHVRRVRQHQRCQSAVRVPAVRLVAWLPAQAAFIRLRTPAGPISLVNAPYRLLRDGCNHGYTIAQD